MGYTRALSNSNSVAKTCQPYLNPNSDHNPTMIRQHSVCETVLETYKKTNKINMDYGSMDGLSAVRGYQLLASKYALHHTIFLVSKLSIPKNGFTGVR